VRTLKILGREVFLGLPEWWDVEFEKDRPRGGRLTFYGPIRPVGYVRLRLGGESKYQLQVTSGTIKVFTVEESVEESFETAMPNAIALNVYPSSVVTFYAPPVVRVVNVVRRSAKEIR